MCRISGLLPVIAVLAVGCVSPGRNAGADYQPKTQIERRLTEIFDAAAKKDMNRLDSYHFYGPKFTKFAAEQPGRQDATAARKAEHQGLGSINDLSIKAEELKIDVFGDVGIATFVMRYTFKAGTDTIEKKARSTLVVVKEGAAWRIAHEHFSAFPSNP